MQPFQKRSGPQPHVRVVLTGIGRSNAARTVPAALAEQRPDLVLTCGFAGGLNPALARETVVFSADADVSLVPALQAAGARLVRFHCAERVAVTVKDKADLRRRTGADAVDMESEVIRAICGERQIPSATVRVISDVAQEDLPLDFNEFLDAEQNLKYGKLTLALAKAPGKMAALLKLQKHAQSAAERLASVLAQALASCRP